MHAGRFVVALSLVIGACGGTVAADGRTQREPAKHRPAAVACVTGTLAGPSPPCASDAECTAGPQGRCMPPGGQGTCVYSYCTTDADCAANQVCECSPDGYANRCVSATGCALDSDCPGSFCSPTFGTCGPYSGVVGYECHTPQDVCVDDADCPGGYCMYEPAAGHWVCGSGSCVG